MGVFTKCIIGVSILIGLVDANPLYLTSQVLFSATYPVRSKSRDLAVEIVEEYFIATMGLLHFHLIMNLSL